MCPSTRGSLIALVLACALPGPANAQDTEAWNSTRARELMERARQRRAEPLADSLLRNYQAAAAGMVYFYLDRRETEERTLVKSDQIALEVYWGAPDRTKQRIVGMRGENSLPNRMYYHLDHLTVVQNEFGDVIRLGDGDEVRDVPHPAAPGSEAVYDFRLSDSLSIRLPGAAEPVRAYRIDVRPKREDEPALVGAVYVDRGSGDIVRMTFTFTPASYVDPRLDYINISLDNSLWEGRYWLPREQSVEIRRQIPELDFVAGAVIQGRFRVTDYVFNQDLQPDFFDGYPVTAAPRAEREAYPFPTQLYDDLVESGLAPPPQMRDIRAAAADLLGRRALSGLPRLRLSLGGASSAFRYDRAEGAFLGAGASYAPGPELRFDGSAGYAFGAEHPAATASLRADASPTLSLRVGAFLNEPRDIGLREGMPGALNTLTSLLVGNDYQDLFYATGAQATLAYRLAPRSTVSVRVAAERHESAALEAATVLFDDADAFRPVLPVAEGDRLSATLSLRRAPSEAANPTLDTALDLEAGFFEGEAYFRPTAELVLHRSSSDLRTTVRARALAGLLFGAKPAQSLFYFGGRNTLPGYPYRAFTGERAATADLEITRDVFSPWLGLRVIAAAGSSGGFDALDLLPPPGPEDPPSFLRPGWAGDTDGLRYSAGAGASVFYDLLRFDVVRGLRRGEWQLLVSLRPDLWGML